MYQVKLDFPKITTTLQNLKRLRDFDLVLGFDKVTEQEVTEFFVVLQNLRFLDRVGLTVVYYDKVTRLFKEDVYLKLLQGISSLRKLSKLFVHVLNPQNSGNLKSVPTFNEVFQKIFLNLQDLRTVDLDIICIQDIDFYSLLQALSGLPMLETIDIRLNLCKASVTQITKIQLDETYNTLLGFLRLVRKRPKIRFMEVTVFPNFVPQTKISSLEKIIERTKELKNVDMLQVNYMPYALPSEYSFSML